MNRRIFPPILLALGLAVAAGPALAQPAPAGPADCPGDDWTTVRVSKLKPGGTLDGLRKAMADHVKWYRDHGYGTDQFTFGQVMAYDPKLKRRAPAEGKYVTIRAHSSEVPKSRHDAAWDAYVAEYAANSTIESTTVVCMMK